MTGTDFFGVLELLVRREVQFVLIGGLAARLHGSPTVTMDIDICPARDTDNLGRLAGALRAMDAQVPSVNETVPFELDVKTLGRSTNLTLMTSRGALDVLGEPAGTDGYRDLAANAITLEVEGLKLKVASLDDLMRMKEASGRPKDRIELEVLGALRDELQG